MKLRENKTLGKIFKFTVIEFYLSYLLSPSFFKKAKGILQSPLSVRLSVMLSPPKPLDEIQTNLVCELLT